ncbi:MAG TPA: beta-ketoacyl synthase N-terminal-like domain-containing protein [Roseococcus sp.]|jgi:myxalamid-type polyketide synthase MxaE and MxaD|nr:beta-ketoacyl synthase N-terminal-like domain-containing protein [Roseococcus sp.]
MTELTTEQRALAAIRTLRARVAELEGAARERIAVIGMACRFPGGADSPGAYWRLLAEGRDATREAPPERGWDAWHDPTPRRGRLYVKRGGFLDEVAGFDAGFFDLSPREAAALDPQHRLALELAVEALEDAGLPRARLAGSRTGVFLALDGTDYAEIQGGAIYGGDAYTVTGNIHCAAAGRIAHLLDLQGPCEVMDTACSSSLVAIHRAAQALRAGECDIALAGGVNLMLSPLPTILACQLRSLAPDGRCKAFDAAADGYARGEGGGLVVLRRARDAGADRVHAWLLGSATNHDGRAAGLTQPNPVAQARVLRAALEAAGIGPEVVGYVEAHGSGTALGDPIEFSALREVYGGAATACAIGTAKTNLGHLEAAAGIAGFLKAVLALKHGAIPAHLHLREVNPRIALEGTRFRIPRATEAWAGAGRHAAVSAFGISGTNAHAVLAAADAPMPGVRPAPLLATLSAADPAALAARVATLAARLRAAPGQAPTLAAATLRLSTLPEHVAAASMDGPGLAAALEAALAARGPTPRQAPPLALVIPGHAGLRPGMFRDLLEAEPAFTAGFAAAEAALLEAGAESPRAALLAEAPPEDVARLHPALFAANLGLAAWFRAMGLAPRAVVGHSFGEVAAACIAGALSLPDAARVIHHRSRLLARLAGQGGMALAGLGEDEALAEAARHGLALAAVNGPRSAVLSGPEAGVAALLQDLAARGMFCRRIPITIPAHGPATEPLLAEFRASLAGIAPRAGEAVFHSTVTGAALEGAALTPDYWARNLRQPVRFAEAVSGLRAAGPVALLELGPQPVLLADLGPGAVAALRRDVPEPLALREAVAALFTAGLAPDGAALGADPSGLDLLPRYPWQRRRHWVDAAMERMTPGAHPVLGAEVPLAGAPGRRLWQGSLSVEAPSWLAEHRVAGEVLLPAAATIEAAAATLPAAAPAELRDLRFLAPLKLAEGAPRRIQAQVEDGGFRLYAAAGPGWEQVAEAHVATGAPPAPLEAPDAFLAACTGAALDGAAHRSAALAQAIDYGPAFRAVREVRRGEGRAWARLDPGVAAPEPACRLHPALLDAVLQVLSAALPSAPDSAAPFVPAAIARCRLAAQGEHPGPWTVQARLTATRPGLAGFTGDLALLDATGRAIAAIEGLEVVQPRAAAGEGWLLRLDWRAAPPPPGAPGADWIFLGMPEVLARLPAGARRVTRAEDLATAPPATGIALLAEGLTPADILATLQAVLRRAERDRPALLCVTAGAMQDDPVPEQAAIWGLVRALGHEHPELRPRLLDLPAGQAVPLAELDPDAAEDQVAWRSGVRHVARLVPAALPPLPPALAAEEGVLLTGAAGALAAPVARRMLALGARRFHLAARDAHHPALLALAMELRAAGAFVQLLGQDLAAPDAAARLLAALEGPPPRVILHAAGAVRDGTLRRLDAAALDHAAAPKARFAEALAEGLSGHGLRAFVIFSSAAGLLGAPGQGAHAAASAAADALALRLRARGVPATAIAWGPWQGTEAAEGLADTGRAALRGIGEIPLEAGLDLLARALAPGAPAAFGVLPLDLRRWRDYHIARADWPLLAELAEPAPAAPRAATDWRALAEAEASRRMLELVRAEAARVFRLAPAALAPEDGFAGLGLDSLMGLEIRNRLEAVLGLALPATLLWTHPTPAALARDLLARLRPAPAPAPHAAATAAPVPEGGLDAALAAEAAALRNLLSDLEDA